MVSPPELFPISRFLSLEDDLEDGEGSVTGVTVTLLRDDKADIAAAATSLL